MTKKKKDKTIKHTNEYESVRDQQLLYVQTTSELQVPICLGTLAKLRKVTTVSSRHVCPSVRPSVRMEQLSSNWIDFMKFDTWVFFENPSRTFKIHYNLTRITNTLHEDQHSFWSYLAQFFLEWEIFLLKVAEKIKAH
jgi:hypothetical protein